MDLDLLDCFGRKKTLITEKIRYVFKNLRRMDTHAKEETDILLPCFPIRSSIEGKNLHIKGQIVSFQSIAFMQRICCPGIQTGSQKICFPFTKWLKLIMVYLCTLKNLTNLASEQVTGNEQI